MEMVYRLHARKAFHHGQPPGMVFLPTAESPEHVWISLRRLLSLLARKRSPELYTDVVAQSLYASDVRFREEEREGEAGWLFDYHWFMAEFQRWQAANRGFKPGRISKHGNRETPHPCAGPSAGRGIVPWFKGQAGSHQSPPNHDLFSCGVTRPGG